MDKKEKEIIDDIFSLFKVPGEKRIIVITTAGRELEKTNDFASKDLMNYVKFLEGEWAVKLSKPEENDSFKRFRLNIWQDDD